MAPPKVSDSASLSRQVLDYIRDPSVALWRKASGLVAAIYVVSPVDFVPDLLPIVGWLDDFGVMGGITWFLIRDIRKHAKRLRAGPPPGAPPEPPIR